MTNLCACEFPTCHPLVNTMATGWRLSCSDWTHTCKLYVNIMYIYDVYISIYTYIFIHYHLSYPTPNFFPKECKHPRSLIALSKTPPFIGVLRSSLVSLQQEVNQRCPPCAWSLYPSSSQQRWSMKPTWLGRCDDVTSLFSVFGVRDKTCWMYFSLANVLILL